MISCFCSYMKEGNDNEVHRFNPLAEEIEKKQLSTISPDLSVCQLAQNEFPEFIKIIKFWIKNATSDCLRCSEKKQREAYQKFSGVVSVLTGFSLKLAVIKRQEAINKIYTCFADQNESLSAAQGFCLVQNQMEKKRACILHITINPDKIVLPKDVKLEEEVKQRKGAVANKKGVGTILIATVADKTLKDQQLESIDLIPINNSEGFYKKLGFQPKPKEKYIYFLDRNGMQKLVLSLGIPKR